MYLIKLSNPMSDFGNLVVSLSIFVCLFMFLRLLLRIHTTDLIRFSLIEIEINEEGLHLYVAKLVKKEKLLSYPLSETIH